MFKEETLSRKEQFMPFKSFKSLCLFASSILSFLRRKSSWVNSAFAEERIASSSWQMVSASFGDRFFLHTGQATASVLFLTPERRLHTFFQRGDLLFQHTFSFCPLHDLLLKILVIDVKGIKSAICFCKVVLIKALGTT